MYTLIVIIGTFMMFMGPTQTGVFSDLESCRLARDVLLQQYMETQIQRANRGEPHITDVQAYCEKRDFPKI